MYKKVVPTLPKLCVSPHRRSVSHEPHPPTVSSDYCSAYIFFFLEYEIQGRVSTYWTSIYMQWNNGCICLYNTPLNFSLHIFLTKNICSIVFMCMSAWLYICMYTTCVPILKEARKGHQILCRWNLRNLLTIMWVLGTEFTSSIIAASALNHQIISAHSRYSREIIKE